MVHSSEEKDKTTPKNNTYPQFITGTLELTIYILVVQQVY